MRKITVRRILSFLVLAPLGLVLVTFAVVNRHMVPLDFWPLPVSMRLPFAVAMMFIFVIGVLWGGMVSWMNALNSRRLARKSKRRASQLEIQLRQLKDRIRALEAEIHGSKQVLEDKGSSEGFRPSISHV